jgi:polypeptide N-acetylgalactosaminyltransferase
MNGWLEPILDRFRINMNRLVWPKIGGISKKTLKIELDNRYPGAIGGFDWGMNFKWINYKSYEKSRNISNGDWDPKPSVTAIGAIFAISKQFFKHLGMLDPDFGIWGGEDVELSFKVWMCGGEVEFVPCSTAFHMFKDHKYTVSLH